MNKILFDDAIAGSVAKLALCGTAAAFHPVALAGVAFTAKDVIDNCLSLSLAAAKYGIKGRETAAQTSETDAEALFERSKRHFGHDARFDIAADATVQAEVAAFFDQAVLDLVLPAENLGRFRDAVADRDGAYAGIAGALIDAIPGSTTALATEGHRLLARAIVTRAVESAIRAAELQDDLLIVMQEAQFRQLASLVQAFERSPMAQQARDDNVSASAVRGYLEKALKEGFAETDILGWLPDWIERARVVFATGGNDDAAFQKALAEADRLFEARRMSEASQPIMDDLARLERDEVEVTEEFRRRKRRRIEKAIEIDELALNFAGMVEKLYVWARIESALTQQAEAEFLFQKAGEYYDKGENALTPSPLLAARSAYDSALEVYTRQDFPVDWAGTQNNLGMVKQRLGERLDGAMGIAALNEARSAYDSALEVYTRQDFPVDWAMTQNNLGIVLQRLGERLDGAAGIAALNEARSAYDSALEVYTRQDFPVNWAMTQNNLGIVLRTLGDRLDGAAGIAALNEARSAYDSALEVYTRQDFPVNWAMTQNNLAVVLRTLGDRLGGAAGIAALNDARIVCDAALVVYTRQDFPVDWAMTQNTLGNVLQRLGGRLDGAAAIAALNEACIAYDAALEVYTRDYLPFDWAATQNNLGSMQQMLGERLEGAAGVAALNEARSAYDAALDVRTRQHFPVQWAMTRENIAILCLALYRRTGDPSHLGAGMKAVSGALEVYHSIHSDYDIGTAERLLGDLQAAQD